MLERSRRDGNELALYVDVRRRSSALFIVTSIALEIVAAACGSAPQTGVGPGPAPAPGPSSLTLVGRVLDRDTGAGLAAANFYIIGGANSGRNAVTGADGSFTFSQLE